eukprot:gene19772-21707_t
MESNVEKKNTREVYKTIKNLTEPRTKQISVIEDKDGTVVTGSNEVAKRLCNRILRSAEWPSQWTESILIPIPKKADQPRFKSLFEGNPKENHT